MTALPLLCGAACVWYGHRILRLLRFAPENVLVGTAFLLVLPALFISSYALEADILLAALMTAVIYYGARFATTARQQTRGEALRLGVLAGLAASTKYNGVLALIYLAFLPMMAITADRTALFRNRVLPALLVALVVGGGKYLDNWLQYGNPLFANGSALSGFAVLGQPAHIDRYEFGSFDLESLLVLTREDAPQGRLTDLPIYRSFWSAMYGLTWNDLGMFTNPTRHGGQPYPKRRVPPWLAATVLVSGLFPTALAVFGLVTCGARTLVRPYLTISILTALAYIPWVLRQTDWALKPKYLLFLAPVYCVFALLGTEVLTRRVPGVTSVVWRLWLAVLVFTAAYLWCFATSTA